MKPSEILIAAKGLIDAPEKWIKGASARDKNGNRVPTLSKSAVCRCSIGAIYADHDTCADEIDMAIDYLDDVIGSEVATWNDAPERTWEEVMSAFDRAIAAAQKEEE